MYITLHNVRVVGSGGEREIESSKIKEVSRQPVMMKKANTDQVNERAGGVSRQLDVNQLQPMEVSLDRSDMTGTTKRKTEIQLMPNNCDGCIDGLKRFD